MAMEWIDVLEIGPECNERFVECKKVPELAELDITISGVSDLAGHYRVGRRDPVCHTIIYGVQGSIELYTEAGHQTVEKGNLITLPAHKPFLIKLKAPCWSMVWFDLTDGARWNDLCIERPSISGCESTRQLFHLLSLIYYERNQVLRESPMKQLSYYLKETLSSHFPNSVEHQRIKQLIGDFEKRLHFDWSIKEMTQLIHYSESHLHRLFQKHHGKSPLQFLISLRMERAKYLLIHTNWSIEQIADQVGYKDVFNFSKRFKKSISMPPGQYRKRKLNFTKN